MNLDTWLVFVVACLLISLSPGAGAFCAMSSGAEFGFRHGYWAAIGLQVGLFLQILLVAVGLGAVVATSKIAFLIIKWCGVFYLAYLGWQLWTKTHAESPDLRSRELPKSAWSLVRRGFWINISNPKSIVFLLAVLPQFIAPSAPLIPQYAAATGTMIGLESVVMAGYTALGARLLAIFQSPRHRMISDRVCGSIFFLLAALLAWQEKS